MELFDSTKDGGSVAGHPGTDPAAENEAAQLSETSLARARGRLLSAFASDCLKVQGSLSHLLGLLPGDGQTEALVDLQRLDLLHQGLQDLARVDAALAKGRLDPATRVATIRKGATLERTRQTLLEPDP